MPQDPAQQMLDTAGRRKLTSIHKTVQAIKKGGIEHHAAVGVHLKELLSHTDGLQAQKQPLTQLLKSVGAYGTALDLMH